MCTYLTVQSHINEIRRLIELNNNTIYIIII